MNEVVNYICGGCGTFFSVKNGVELRCECGTSEQPWLEVARLTLALSLSKGDVVSIFVKGDDVKIGIATKREGKPLKIEPNKYLNASHMVDTYPIELDEELRLPVEVYTRVTQFVLDILSLL